jgi:hypothetical protein
MSDEFLDAPIPGASFTEPVGTAAWQSPPKYTKPNDALAYIMSICLTQKNYDLMRAALELGLPLDPMVDTVLFGAFSEGAFTVDVLLLIKPAVLEALESMFIEDGLDFITEMPDKEDEDYEKIMQLAVNKRMLLGQNDVTEEVEEVEEEEEPKIDIPKTGLMGK